MFECSTNVVDMKRFEVLVLCLCVTLSFSELLGPEVHEGSDKNKDEDDSSETLDNKPRVDEEYIKELTDAVNKEIMTLQEYADVMKSSTSESQDEDSNKGKFIW